MLAAVVLAVKVTGAIIIFFLAGCALSAGFLSWLILDALCR